MGNRAKLVLLSVLVLTATGLSLSLHRTLRAQGNPDRPLRGVLFKAEDPHEAVKTIINAAQFPRDEVGVIFGNTRHGPAKKKLQNFFKKSQSDGVENVKPNRIAGVKFQNELTQGKLALTNAELVKFGRRLEAAMGGKEPGPEKFQKKPRKASDGVVRKKTPGELQGRVAKWLFDVRFKEQKPAEFRVLKFVRPPNPPKTDRPRR